MKFGGRALELQRIPEDPDLQAWDQADLYALDHLTEPGRVLIVLDAFGALACACLLYTSDAADDQWRV